jgi:hypothetical protein
MTPNGAKAEAVLVNEAIKKLRQLTGAGTLGQKYQDINMYVGAGHSMLYSGDVSWQLKMPTQTLHGDAESIDSALEQLKLLFEDFLRSLRPDTKVALTLKELHNPKD